MIASRFKGVPNWLDAATQYNSDGILFYKKDMVYFYSFKDKKVINTDLLSPDLFK